MKKFKYNYSLWDAYLILLFVLIVFIYKGDVTLVVIIFTFIGTLYVSNISTDKEIKASNKRFAKQIQVSHKRLFKSLKIQQRANLQNSIYLNTHNDINSAINYSLKLIRLIRNFEGRINNLSKFFKASTKFTKSYREVIVENLNSCINKLDIFGYHNLFKLDNSSYPSINYLRKLYFNSINELKYNYFYISLCYNQIPHKKFKLLLNNIEVNLNKISTHELPALNECLCKIDKEYINKLM